MHGSKRIYQKLGKLIFGNIFAFVNERPISEITPRPVQWVKKIFGEGKIGKICKKKLFLSAKMMFYLISCLWLSFGRLRVRISLLGQNCTTSAYIKTILLNFLLTKLKKNWTGPTFRDHCTMHNDSNRAVLKGVSNERQILNVFLSQSMSQLKKDVWTEPRLDVSFAKFELCCRHKWNRLNNIGWLVNVD